VFQRKKTVCLAGTCSDFPRKLAVLAGKSRSVPFGLRKK